jgi:hypothetical protein
MSLNPSANFPNLAALSAKALAWTSGQYQDTVSYYIQDYLTKFTEDSYEDMVAALADASSNLDVNPNLTFRMLVAQDDGTVVYDSSKGIANNIYSNVGKAVADPDTGVVTPKIGENHNSRPEILVAILGSTGVGISSRYSRTSAKFLKYQANRLGNSTQSNLGTFRVSIQETV